MKLLMVANSDWGMYQFNSHLAAALLAQGVEVVLLCPEGPYSARMREAGLRVLNWHLRRRSLAPITEALALLHLIWHYRKERPDAVHHFTIKPNIYGSIAAQIARVPRVMNTWTGLGYVFSDAPQARVLRRFLVPLMRWLYRSARVRTIFQTEHDRQDLLRLGVVERHHTAVVISPGVDTSRFAAREGRASGSPIVLMAARLLHTKGVVDLLTAAELLRGRDVDVRTLIAGAPDPGNPESFSDEEIARMRQAGCAKFLGHVEDMPGLLGTAAIAVLPTHSEGVPVFLVEAAASGLPLIGTDIEGCRVIVRNGVNGLIVPVRNPKALADAIASLASNAALRAQMGAASREIAIREFDQSQVIEQYSDVYRAAGVLN